MNRIIMIILFIIQHIIGSNFALAADFQIRAITDKIFIVNDPAGGEDQLVINSEKGLIVFDTFWSQITARQYKAEIVKYFKRDDFAYTINMVDRLDMFGGNAAYGETSIVGHDSFLDKFTGKQDEVKAEIRKLTDMWRRKADAARKRLETLEKDSDKAGIEQRWIMTCQRRADELEAGFSLILPTLVYSDRMSLDLGDLTLKLIWFGKAGNYNGMTVVVIPEEKLAIIPGFILHAQHLAPYPYHEYAELDVERWISILEELLEGKNAVERVICDMSDVWTRERAVTHLEYIRNLWNGTKEAALNGKDLDSVQDQFSLEKDFAFVKEMQVYKDHGDEWVRPQHQAHVQVFFLQHKNPRP